MERNSRAKHFAARAALIVPHCPGVEFEQVLRSLVDFAGACDFRQFQPDGSEPFQEIEPRAGAAKRFPKLERPWTHRGYALDQRLEQTGQTRRELEHPFDNAAENACQLVEDFPREPTHARPDPAGESAQTFPDPSAERSQTAADGLQTVPQRLAEAFKVGDL